MNDDIQQNHFSNEVDDFYGLSQDLLRPVTSGNRPVPNRWFYPLAQHQEEFNAIERRLGQAAEPRVGLNNLTDGGNNPPPHTLAVIIKCAILGSPYGRLTLREIRIAMCKRFTYYYVSENGTGWCNTIRHTLTTDPNFQSVPRVRTADDSGNWWRLVPNAEPPDLTPSPSRSRRPAQASSSSNRSRPQGIPTQSRRRRVEPWMEMTTTFATSEAQDREDLHFQYSYMHAGQDPVNQQQSEYATGYYASAASASTSYQRSAEATTNLADHPAPGGQLPGIHSLGLPGLGMRSGSRSHQLHSQATYRGTYDENEDYYDEENDDN